LERRDFGKTGFKVSILSLGGFHLLEVGRRDASRIVNRYLDLGGNYVETAAQYGNGNSERKIGEVLKTRREECFLTTKCHLRTKREAEKTLERSLRNLQTDHVDLVLIHHLSTYEELAQVQSLDGAFAALDDARKAGKIRFIGVSGHGHPELLKKALETLPLDAVMVETNYYDRFNFPRTQVELIPFAARHKMAVIGMKAVGDGFLWQSWEKAFRYAWSLPVSTVVAGMNTLKMVEQDVALAESFKPMTSEEVESLFLEAPELGNYVCRQCGKCLPCPVNIDIPTVFLCEGLYDRQMRDEIIRDPPEFALRDRLRFWFDNQQRAAEEYEKLSPKADACTKCGECVPRCPYKLPIIEKLEVTHSKLTEEIKTLGATTLAW